MHLVFNFPSNQMSTIILTSIIDSLLNNFLSSHIYLSRKHRRGWEGAALEFDAGCSYQHHCPRIGAMSECFFFFQIWANSAPICANSASIRTNSGQFGQNRVVSTKSDRISRQPKLTETVEKAEIVWLWIKDKSEAHHLVVNKKKKLLRWR